MDDRDLAELAEFVKAQIDEDERVARAVPKVDDFVDELLTWSEMSPDRASEAHVRLHDPARVLREVEAKRVRIVVCADALAGNQPQVGSGDKGSRLYNEGVRVGSQVLAEAMLQAEALPYADRPGYKQCWRP